MHLRKWLTDHRNSNYDTEAIFMSINQDFETDFHYRVPTEIQKHNSMIFHDQQCNYHDYLMHGLQPITF